VFGLHACETNEGCCGTSAEEVFGRYEKKNEDGLFNPKQVAFF
jgi:hypothetical protein